ncbi:MAG: HD domain-containing protein [Flavobacteriales bacterium]|nr:HD domain-containing protein [Flavobacteriales bacterium]
MAESSEYLKIKEYVERFLTENLAPELYYHDVEHTKQVVSAVEEIGVGEGLDAETIELLKIAAWFHDTGYTKKYIGHEDESKEIARSYLSAIGYDEHKIQRICSLIDATRYKHEPENIEEACLLDADRLSVGKVSFILRGEKLRREWEIFMNKFHSDQEWYEVQVNYLKETVFYTNYAYKNYTLLKDNNIEKFYILRENATPESITTRIRKKTLKRSKKVVKILWQLLAIGLLFSLSVTFTVWGFQEYSLVTGLIAGTIMGLLLRFFEKPYETAVEKKITFPFSIFARTLILVFLFLASIGFSAVIYAILLSRKPSAEVYADKIEFVFSTPENIFRFLILAFLLSFLFNFVKLASRILGPRVLRNYMLGKYFRPHNEERIFMFIDINSSTALAEKLGPHKYHLLLSDFFKDISSAIEDSKGEIYQYVGDEVVVTWSMKDGIKKNNCVRCFFDIEKNITRLRHQYENNYGIRPDFKAGLHGGNVITAEVGQIKSEIVFHGDVVNTSERILSQCHPLGKKFLVSEYVIRKLNLLPYYEAEFVSAIRLKGKGSEMGLYSIRVAEGVSNRLSRQA